MAPSVRDRISVDLGGLRAALFEQARASGVSPSAFVRNVVARSLDGARLERDPAEPARTTECRVRISLRLSPDDARRLAAAARAADLPIGAYVAGLAAGVPILKEGGSRADHLAALVASTAELSTLSRNLHHLARLLQQGNVRAAFEYAEMLKTLEGDVRAHLVAAASGLAALRPVRLSSASADRPRSRL